MKINAILILVGLLMLPTAHAAKISKWIDADGKVHYGDKPPAGAVSKKRVRVNNSRGIGGSSVIERGRAAEKRLDEQQRKLDEQHRKVTERRQNEIEAHKEKMAAREQTCQRLANSYAAASTSSQRASIVSQRRAANCY